MLYRGKCTVECNNFDNVRKMAASTELAGLVLFRCTKIEMATMNSFFFLLKQLRK